MKPRILILIIAGCILSAWNVAFAQGGASHFAPSDTGNSAPKWMTDSWSWMTKHIGGDLFLGPEVYGLHMTAGGPLNWDLGPGVELRVRPLFVGGTVGWCGNDNLPSLDSYSSFYIGAIIWKWRFELGQLNATGHNDHGEQIGVYVSDFAGFSRKFGKGWFIEPEVKIMYPIVSHSWNEAPGNYANGASAVITEQYRLRDLYFAIGVTLGLGFN